MRKFLQFIAFIFILAAVGAGAAAYLLFVPGEIPANYAVQVGKGQGIAAVARQLQNDGVIFRREILQAAAYVQGTHSSLKEGRYRLTSPVSVWEILQKLEAGRPELINIRLAEGQKLSAVRAALAADGRLAHRTADLTEKAFVQLLDPQADYANAEGLLFPETYLFADGSDDIAVYRTAHRTLKQHLDNVWQNRADNLPYADAYEMLIMASIIEKETARDDERALVSAVFVNRLKRNMRLQTDPAVIYGMGAEYSGRIRKADLQRDTPYNTYTRHGLPPTPIATVSLASLQAAAHPADSDYLYFVAKQDGSGQSHFSRTLDEHNRAVRRYILRR